MNIKTDNSLFKSQETIDKARKSFKEWEDGGFLGADTNIIEVLKCFNQVEGVATVFSCGGHLKVRVDSVPVSDGDRGITTESYTYPFIMCIVTEQGFNNTLSIYDKLARKVVDRKPGVSKIFPNALRMTLSPRVMGTPAEHYWYNPIIFGLDSYRPKHVRDFIRLLLEVFSDVGIYGSYQ